MRSLNPFAKYDVSDFPGVLKPLARTQRHPVVRRPSVTSDKSKLVEERPDDDTTSDAASRASQQAGVRTQESLKAEVEDEVALSGHDTAYDRKSILMNKAIADIGMGRYQWRLFVLCGFGWLADNLWLQGVALTLEQLSAEFGIDSERVRYTTLALFVSVVREVQTC